MAWPPTGAEDGRRAGKSGDTDTQPDSRAQLAQGRAKGQQGQQGFRTVRSSRSGQEGTGGRTTGAGGRPEDPDGQTGDPAWLIPTMLPSLPDWAISGLRDCSAEHGDRGDVSLSVLS